MPAFGCEPFLENLGDPSGTVFDGTPFVCGHQLVGDFIGVRGSIVSVVLYPGVFRPRQSSGPNDILGVRSSPMRFVPRGRDARLQLLRYVVADRPRERWCNPVRRRPGDLSVDFYCHQLDRCLGASHVIPEVAMPVVDG